MRHYCLFLLSVICLLSQGCDNGDGHSLDMTETQKKVVVSLEGIPEETYPWVSLDGNTGHVSLYVVQDDNVKFSQDGTFYIPRGQVPPSGKVMMFYKGHNPGTIFFSIRYFKLLKRVPSDKENLTVRVKGYTDNVLRLDTTRVMRAFGKEGKTELSDYTFGLSF